jgi:hypothetical protein
VDFSTGSGLPMQESAITTATTTWTFTTPGSGSYNAAYDLWFNVGKTDYEETDPPSGMYIMVWPYSQGSIQPAGSQTGTATIAGKTYQVWSGGSGANGKPYVAYVAEPKTTTVDLDLKPFFTDAVANHGLNASWYLSAIQAGFEIWNGGVGLGTTSFSASVN